MRFLRVVSSLLLVSPLMIGCTSISPVAGKTSSPSRLLYDNSSGERGITTFQLDERGRVEKAVWRLESGKRSSINHYFNDENGRMVRLERTYSDGGTQVETLEYDELGRLVRETFDRSDGVHGIVVSTWDDANHTRTRTCDRLKGWFTGEIVTSLDERGQARSADVFQKGTKIGGIAYENDASGRLVREVWTLGKWSQTFIYEYDRCPAKARQTSVVPTAFARPAKGWRLAGERYSFKGGPAGPSTYEYDTTGRLAMKRFDRSDGFSTTTEFVAGCDGAPAVSFRRQSDGPVAVSTYRYGDDGRFLSRDLVTTDGRRSRETYEYDGAGKLASARWDNVDFWLTGRLTFSRDSSGRLSSGRFEGDDGATAEIRFAHDEHGNLNRIEWSFARGGAQTWTFEYEPVG